MVIFVRTPLYGWDAVGASAASAAASAASIAAGSCALKSTGRGTSPPERAPEREDTFELLRLFWISDAGVFGELQHKQSFCTHAALVSPSGIPAICPHLFLSRLLKVKRQALALSQYLRETENMNDWIESVQECSECESSPGERKREML